MLVKLIFLFSDKIKKLIFNKAEIVVIVLSLLSHMKKNI